MLLVSLSRHQQGKQQVYRLIVRGIEINGFLQREQGAQGLVAVLHPTVGNGDSLAQPGTAELFPADKLGEHFVVGQGGLVLADNAGKGLK